MSPEKKISSSSEDVNAKVSLKALANARKQFCHSKTDLASKENKP